MMDMNTSSTLRYLSMFTLLGLVVVFVTYYIVLQEFEFSVTQFVLVAVFSVIAYTNAVMAARLYYLKELYYEERFKVDTVTGGGLRVRYLKNKSLKPFQLVLFLFKPLRYMEVGEFVLENTKTIELEGTIEVVNNRLLIGDYYLKRNTELYEFIGEDIKLSLKVDNQEYIEKNLRNYKVESVQRQD